MYLSVTEAPHNFESFSLVITKTAHYWPTMAWIQNLSENKYSACYEVRHIFVFKLGEWYYIWTSYQRGYIYITSLVIWIQISRVHKVEWNEWEWEAGQVRSWNTLNAIQKPAVHTAILSYCRAKPKDSICLVHKWADTAFWLLRSLYTENTMWSHLYIRWTLYKYLCIPWQKLSELAIIVWII